MEAANPQMLMNTEKRYEDEARGKDEGERSLHPETSPMERGRWGEEIAAKHLMRMGWRILGRNVHPCRRDRRCELDIIAYAPSGKCVVFIEVKTHMRHSPYANRLWAVDADKKRNLLRASANWLMRRRWHGNFRFDVLEIYGGRESGTAPEIDHIENVRLFPDNWRFW